MVVDRQNIITRSESRTRKRRKGKAGKRGKMPVDELAQSDKKHRDKYTGENKRHLEGV
jgi:hypothetical protein